MVPPLSVILFFAEEENFKAQIVSLGIFMLLSSFNTFPTTTIIFSLHPEYLIILDNEIGD